MTTHATRTASLLSLNLLIDEYESAIASYTSSAWPDLHALDGRVYSALAEHHEGGYSRPGHRGSRIRPFQLLHLRRSGSHRQEGGHRGSRSRPEHCGSRQRESF